MAKRDDDRFDALLDQYLNPPPRKPNPEFEGIVIQIDAAIERKLWSKHRIAAQDVEDAVKGSPPPVEEIDHEDPELRKFFGFTRTGRGLFVVGAWKGRTLRVITAFEPDDDEDYWKRQR